MLRRVLCDLKKALVVASVSVSVASVSVRAAAGAPPCAGAVATVSIDWDRSAGGMPVQGVVARVTFPPSLALERRDGTRLAVDNLTASKGGLFNAAAEDTDHDGGDDLVSIGLVGSDIGTGRFADVRFECRGDELPEAAALSCKLEAATFAGSHPGTCRVELKVTRPT
jgi:hypothetical protein